MIRAQHCFKYILFWGQRTLTVDSAFATGNDSAAHATLTCLCTLCIQVRTGHDCTPFISKRAFWSAVRGWWGHSLRLLVNAKQSFLSAPERNDRTAMEHPTSESRSPPRCGGVHHEGCHVGKWTVHISALNFYSFQSLRFWFLDIYQNWIDCFLYFSHLAFNFLVVSFFFFWRVAGS